MFFVDNLPQTKKKVNSFLLHLLQIQNCTSTCELDFSTMYYYTKYYTGGVKVCYKTNAFDIYR